MDNIFQAAKNFSLPEYFTVYWTNNEQTKHWTTFHKSGIVCDGSGSYSDADLLEFQIISIKPE